ncbi:MAG: carboxypeptidase, partial [Methylobacter sp.]|nr:carboxypeptidase [Methylobacter sp.]
ALIGVVEGGTAGRLRGVYKSADNKPLSVGGKTGTGDHRRKIWRAGGRLIDTVFISRAAVFTFFLGDRFFGVITAYVEGPEAERYHFTSSVPVQIIKFLEPTLAPLLNKVPDKEHQPVVAESASDKKTEPTKSTKDTNNSSKDI